MGIFIDFQRSTLFGSGRCNNIKDMIQRAVELSSKLQLEKEGTKTLIKPKTGADWSDIEKDRENRTVYVEILPPNSNKDTVKLLLANTGPILRVQLPKKRARFAFVEYEFEKDALNAAKTHSNENAAGLWILPLKEWYRKKEEYLKLQRELMASENDYSNMIDNLLANTLKDVTSGIIRIDGVNGVKGMSKSQIRKSLCQISDSRAITRVFFNQEDRAAYARTRNIETARKCAATGFITICNKTLPIVVVTDNQERAKYLVEGAEGDALSNNVTQSSMEISTEIAPVTAVQSSHAVVPPSKESIAEPSLSTPTPSVPSLPLPSPSATRSKTLSERPSAVVVPDTAPSGTPVTVAIPESTRIQYTRLGPSSVSLEGGSNSLEKEENTSLINNANTAISNSATSVKDSTAGALSTQTETGKRRTKRTSAAKAKQSTKQMTESEQIHEPAVASITVIPLPDQVATPSKKKVASRASSRSKGRKATPGSSATTANQTDQSKDNSPESSEQKKEFTEEDKIVDHTAKRRKTRSKNNETETLAPSSSVNNVEHSSRRSKSRAKLIENSIALADTSASNNLLPENTEDNNPYESNTQVETLASQVKQKEKRGASSKTQKKEVEENQIAKSPRKGQKRKRAVEEPTVPQGEDANPKAILRSSPRKSTRQKNACKK